MAHLSTFSKDETIELGTEIGALIGLGIEGEESMDAGAEGATRLLRRGGLGRRRGDPE